MRWRDMQIGSKAKELANVSMSTGFGEREAADLRAGQQRTHVLLLLRVRPEREHRRQVQRLDEFKHISESIRKKLNLKNC